ncbi:nep2 [Symbiodinium natans]|uniref:Nep2 protein n=1 Tax=Symbiodinium natans TaxID=878477 RepID=A0A812I778_9DINO|nr:nep2 [Symbiodinium natans]
MAMASVFCWLLLWLLNAAAGAGADEAPGVERARLYGNLNAYAYYFTDLQVGTPKAQLTSVIIDTGSHLLGFPCGGCDHCGRHLEPGFYMSQSKTAEWTPCKAELHCEHCFENRCQYTEKYSEGSSISGHWFEDYVKLGDVFQENPAVKARMGCHNSENKLFYTQQANGIMGLAPPEHKTATGNILHDLFRDKKHVDANRFAICMADWGGLLSVGGDSAEYHTGGVNWIPMQVDGYYTVHPKSMMVEDRLLAAGPYDFGKAVIDTGTTLTYFPTGVYNSLIATLDAYCALPDKCKTERLPGHPKCWRFKGATTPEGERAALSQANFPTIKMKFRYTEEDVEVIWRPEAYLGKRIRMGELCYAFAAMKQIDQTILGISWLLHKDAIFDVTSQRFGIVDADCPSHHKIPTSLWEMFSGPSWLLQPRLSISLPLVAVLLAGGFMLMACRFWRLFSALYAPRVEQSETGPLL